MLNKSTNFQFLVSRPGYGCKTQALRKVENFLFSEFLFSSLCKISGSARKQDLAPSISEISRKTTKYKTYKERKDKWKQKTGLSIYKCNIFRSAPPRLEVKYKGRKPQISELWPDIMKAITTPLFFNEKNKWRPWQLKCTCSAQPTMKTFTKKNIFLWADIIKAHLEPPGTLIPLILILILWITCPFFCDVVWKTSLLIQV